jgi:hypothetical protein
MVLGRGAWKILKRKGGLNQKNFGTLHLADILRI